MEKQYTCRGPSVDPCRICFSCFSPCDFIYDLLSWFKRALFPGCPTSPADTLIASSSWQFPEFWVDGFDGHIPFRAVFQSFCFCLSVYLSPSSCVCVCAPILFGAWVSVFFPISSRRKHLWWWLNTPLIYIFVCLLTVLVSCLGKEISI